ncbi:MAG TPA: hypothetical protein VI702_03800 [Nitrospiria bacterium]
MKRILMGLLTAVFALSFAGLVQAGMVMGELVKIDGDFYVVKDKDGKEHRIHTDATTKKTGDIKAGSQVEVDEANGHAKSVKPMEMKMDMKK